MRAKRIPTQVNSKSGFTLVAAVLGLLGLTVVSFYDYLLFHVLAEGFSIIVACGMFLLVWNTWDLIENGYLQFLGIAFLFIAGLDLVHTLAYKGMDIFSGYDANLPTQLWIAARMLQSLVLLSAPAFRARKPSRYWLVRLGLLIFAVVLALTFTQTFPDCYIEGQGLTPFKVASEYVISLLLIITILHLFRQRQAFSDEVFWWMVAAVAFSIVSELAFTFYVSVSDLSNLVGHIFKIIAFYFIYRAIVETGLRKPYVLLFRELQQRNEQLAQEAIERKQAEAALRTSKALLDATGRMARVGGWEVDAQTMAVHWTDETYRIHEVPLDYQPPLDEAINFFHPAYRETLSAAIQRALEEGEPYDMEIEFITAKGKPLWTRTICHPQVVDGEVVKLVGTFQDITQLKQAEIQLQAYAESLEDRVAEKLRELEEERAKVIQMDKLAALGEMATSVAHEMTQPLTAIGFEIDTLNLMTAQAQNLEDSLISLDASLLEEVQDDLQRDLARCQRLIEHLRDFGRIAREPPVSLNLNQPIEACFMLVEARLRHSNVEVQLNLADKLPAILADPYKLEQVFLNLLNNAEYAMNKQGEQRAMEGLPYQKMLRITTGVDDGAVYAVVRDNGCGIPADVLAHIYDPFFTTKPQGEGTGLGLSISYGIVTEFGGDIVCESIEGEGTTFTLRFPVADD